jgi:D-beta-D-heptose 7-phosphate kinase / D-beta-D-heptose 1-phosphate adenosyltransferase
MGRVVDLEGLLGEIGDRSSAGAGRVVTTNGCFDILHAGHLATLRAAKEMGDTLVVLVNDDDSVRRLKGASRPLVPAADRAELVAALEPVDFVVLFSEDTPVRALGAIRPAVHVKGGDYTAADLPETAAVEAGGGEVVIVPLVPGRSTSGIAGRAGEGGRSA